MARKDFKFLVKKIQKQSFGILSTVSPKGWSQTSGVLYGSEFIDNKIKIFILTGKNYVKTINISKNGHISFLIPFTHYWLRMIPSFTIFFQGYAKIHPCNYQKGITAHKRKRILKMGLKDLKGEESDSKYVFIEFSPYKRIQVFGVGYSFLETVKNPHGLAYSIKIPE